MTKKIAVLENLIVEDPKPCLRGKRERDRENGELGRQMERKLSSMF